MAMVYINGLIVDDTRELGKVTKCTAKEFSHGEMERNL